MRAYFLTVILFCCLPGWSQPRYVTTINPFQIILKSIVGERGEVHKILPAGASPHTYELRPSDVRKIETAKVMFYGSPTLENWALKFQNPRQIKLIQLLPEEYVLYLKTSEEEGWEKKIGTDPHFWCDPLAVRALLPILTDTLCQLDPPGCEIYRRNAAHFAAGLDSLTAMINNQLTGLRSKTVMLSHPFFLYFFHRFGFQVAGIIEVIPGKEPTPREIQKYIKLVEKRNVAAIFTHWQHSKRPANLVAESTGIKVYELDPLGGIKGRETYYELLLYNVKILIKALR